MRARRTVVFLVRALRRTLAAGLLLLGVAFPLAATCSTDATRLCLNASRFQVQVAWRVPSQDTSGVGMAVPLTSDTGYFWFFSANNVELVIKVVDGRAFNNYFWIFYGALSDVEYTITVTDTTTGARKTYFNPSGTLASVADVTAFGEAGSENLTVLFDEGHFNFHSIATTYARFAEMLRNEGWVVETSNGRFEPALLRRARILVSVSPLAQVNVNNWTLPTPSAFDSDEIAAVRDWVEGGGALLLITDHMPFPGSTGDLAAAFGVRFSNGFAFDTRQLDQPQTCLAQSQVQVFRKSEGSLVDHPITTGIDSVGTFTGSAFETGASAMPLMVFGPTAVSLEPQTAWDFPTSTPRISVSGWRQGAALQHGQGRVAIFGEAAMFTEQTCGPSSGRPMGMNSPAASQNARFLLNVIGWLAGRL